MRSSVVDRLLLSPVTWFITLMNVAVFFIVASKARMIEFPASVLLEMGATERRRIWDGEIWRLATAVVLHWGIIHLCWNAYAMFGWCAAVERSLGSWRFAVAYAASGIGGAAVSVIGHDAISAGASGAGFGVIGVVLCILYRKCGSLAAFLDDRIVKQTLLGIGIWTVVGLVAVRMDHYAHFGGLAFGILTGALFTARSLQKNRLAQAAAAAVVGILFAGTIVGASWPRAGYVAFNRGVEAYERRDFEEAVRQFDEAEKGDSGYYGLFYNRGLAHRALGKWEEAERDFGRALALKPGDPDCLDRRARVRLARGNVKGAIEDLQLALARADRSWERRAEAEMLVQELMKREEKP